MSEAAQLAARLDRALLARGVSAGTSRSLACARALTIAETRTPTDLYWTARIAMLPRIEDLGAFNSAFVSAIGDAAIPEALRARVPEAAQPAARRPQAERLVAPEASVVTADESLAQDTPVVFAMASSQERLSERDFAEFGEHERAEMLRLIARLHVGVETRPSRRRAPHERGDRLDLRATLRSAARTYGELVRRRRSIRRERVRPLVFLCDVSGSMLPYARALLQYAHASAQARPRVRTFAFATRLSDLSSLLARSSADAGRPSLRGRLPDYGGGTRIGAALAAFNERYAQRGVARGGTIVILSDGWEREDPALVRTEMERLRRLTRRIVWVNPQKKHPAYEPLARGMAAALPFVDAFVAGHNLRTLEAVTEAIGATSKRRNR